MQRELNLLEFFVEEFNIGMNISEEFNSNIWTYPDLLVLEFPDCLFVIVNKI